MELTGEYIYQERTKRNMSRKDFAALIDLSQATLFNIERNGRKIKEDEQDRIHAVLQSPPNTVTGVVKSRQGSTVNTAPVTVFLYDIDNDDEYEVLSLGSIELEKEPQELATVVSPMHSPMSTVATPALEMSFPPATASAGVATPISTPELPGYEALHENGMRVLSNSEVQTFKHCRRRWMLSWYHGYRLKKEPVTGARPLGTRIHEALASYYVPEGETPADPAKTLEDLISEDESKLVDSLSDQDTDNAMNTLTKFQNEADLARAMIEGYMEWIAETGVDQDYEVIAPETILTTQIPVSNDLTIQLKGKLDLRLRRHYDKVQLFLDHKTTDSFGRLTGTLHLDEQIKTYQLLEDRNKSADEPRVEGAIFNMLRKVKRSATAKPPFYQRVEITHNQHVISHFYDRLVGEALAIDHVERCLNNGVDHHKVAYPSPSDRCNWGCDYTAICSMFDDNSRVDDFISEHYVQVNPMERYDKDKS